jgi:polyisoprenoid-binding protein YceI
MKTYASSVLLATFFLAVCSALSASAETPAQARSLLAGVDLYRVDDAHTSIAVSARGVDGREVRGTFGRLRGTLALHEDDVERMSASVVIEAASFRLREGDARVATAALVNAERHPLVIFRSTGVDRAEDGYVLHGRLTANGVTHSIDVSLTPGAVSRDPNGADRVAFSGRFSLNRKDYGIRGPRRTARARSAALAIGDTVTVSVTLQATRQDLDQLVPPVADSFYTFITEHGVQEAIRGYQRQHRLRSAAVRVTEGPLNHAAHRLLQHDRVDDALALFRTEVADYPASPFGFVGLAQAYAMRGDRTRAVLYCDKALALDPATTRAMEIRRYAKAGGG